MRFRHSPSLGLFFFNDTATTEIYTLSLHDALPIYSRSDSDPRRCRRRAPREDRGHVKRPVRSEEHTSELQSRPHLVCRLLLENKRPTPSSGPTMRIVAERHG